MYFLVFPSPCSAEQEALSSPRSGTFWGSVWLVASLGMRPMRRHPSFHSSRQHSPTAPVTALSPHDESAAQRFLFLRRPPRKAPSQSLDQASAPQPSAMRAENKRRVKIPSASSNDSQQIRLPDNFFMHSSSDQQISWKFMKKWAVVKFAVVPKKVAFLSAVWASRTATFALRTGNDTVEIVFLMIVECHAPCKLPIRCAYGNLWRWKME